MSPLMAHVDHLRGLAQMERETSLLQLAMLNVLAELAGEVDRLVADHPHPPDTEQGFGTI